ncbi:centrin NDAI_0E01040 [Naumovozyma dairenensis CBS 421]|uniref:EF-hand domain-containing protein n=1 Tax=Naumovozyma dairenensis (strain ATCC 10597 / BCRC 20456 / CBS 421 / NBRC 0211 / NRRL Y-12639) TaxID=1071378 RepID=G0WB00_NAUDC|nr:hypothetical protein NDAI_0E01040 [Naumovozyma dairenensis CBS 421]CCD24920.1 hypothetical protein NDAI_0E01040 [Naumovozyma dairenensis CBS 421]
MNRNTDAELDEDEKRDILEAFNIFDLNKDGHLDFHEFKAATRALGFEVDKKQLLELISHYDKDGRHLINFEDFQEIMIQWMLERDPMLEIKKAFHLFDEDGTGKITMKDLKKLAKSLDIRISDEELKEMIDEFDLDGDGGINEEEFISICTDTS